MTSYAENRKARFNYETLEKYEAGIELLGVESQHFQILAFLS